jgi:uncharacterized protein YcbX
MIATTNEVGSVSGLYRYPIKSMMGEELNATMVGPKGLVGDRLFAVSDPATGKIGSAKNPSKWPNLFSFRASYTAPLEGPGQIPSVRITTPDGTTVTSQDADVEKVLSTALGKPVKFMSSAPASGTLEEYWPDIDGLPKRDEVTDEAMPSETFFDLAIVHILTTATLDAMRMHYPEGRAEVRRFRPNIVISTDPSITGFAEEAWIGKVMAIGDQVKFKITGPCPRCVMTTLAQGDLPKDAGILKTALKHNQAHVGIYASVLQGGKIRRGDVARLEDEA